MLYYILNILLVSIYPLTRVFRIFNFYVLDLPDELGTTRENSIFYTIIAFTVVKYFRSYSTIQFLTSIFYTVKMALVATYVFVDFRISMLYGAACLFIWLICSEPKFNGKTQMIEVETMQQFEEIVGVHFRDDDNGDIIEELNERFKKINPKNGKKSKQLVNYKQSEMVFAEFYADWADTCNHVMSSVI